MQLRVRLADEVDAKMLDEGGDAPPHSDATRHSIVFEVEDTGRGVPEQ